MRLDLFTCDYIRCGEGWETPVCETHTLQLRSSPQLEPNKAQPPLCSGVGAAWEFTSRDCREVGLCITALCALTQTGISSLLKPLLLLSIQTPCCWCFLSFKNIVLKLPSLLGLFDFSVVHTENNKVQWLSRWEYSCWSGGSSPPQCSSYSSPPNMDSRQSFREGKQEHKSKSPRK